MRALRILHHCLAGFGALTLCYIGVWKLGQLFVFPWGWQEKARIPIQGRQCELVVYEGNRGAMSSYAYACFIVKAGGNVNPNRSGQLESVLATARVMPMVRSDRMSHLEIDPGRGYVTHMKPVSREWGITVDLVSQSTQ